VEKPAGIAMGMAPPESFEAVLVERKIKLLPGDCLLLYTDGMLKRMGEDQTFYNLERLKVIFSLYANRPAKTILKMIENDLEQYNALDRPDDIGMMLLKLEEA
jgi:serine phosphatase RsbU (regulator of sigma subunit)